MALPVQVPAQTSIAVLGQTVFPFNFRCDDSTTVRVAINLVDQGGFAVALNADQAATPGGTVTLAAGAAAGASVLIHRVTPLSQNVDITQYGKFPSAAVNAALDRMEMQIQELAVNTGVIAPAVGSTFQPNEVPGGLINSTDGTNNNGTYTLAHVPSANQYMSIYLDGIRQPPNRWVRNPGSNQFTFNAGFHPTVGSDLRVDYYF